MFRLSLRQLFLFVTLAALAVVSLHHASTTCQALVGMFLLLAIFAAVAACIVDRGPRQAFALGFAVVSLPYMLFVLKGTAVNQAELNVELELIARIPGQGYPPHLPTTLVLQEVYKHVGRWAFIDLLTEKELTGFDWTKYQVAITGAGGNQKIEARELPPQNAFMATGHYWWALLLGYVGGHFARFIHLRRLREQTSRKGD